MLPSPSHVVPVVVGDPDLCKAACDELSHRHRIYVQPVRRCRETQVEMASYSLGGISRSLSSRNGFSIGAMPRLDWICRAKSWGWPACRGDRELRR